MAVNDDGVMAAPGPQERLADPEQVFRSLFLQGPARANAGMDEEVAAGPVAEGEVLQEG